ncbi:MAG: fibronectin type III domain-containing protein, partial [Nitrospirae bacterium]
MRLRAGLILLFLIALASCGGGGSSQGKTEGATDVVITIGSRVSTSELGIAAVPEVVRFIALSVTGEGMEPIERVYDVAGRDVLQITLQIPNGRLRHFVALALDENRKIRYRGEAYADLTGEPVTIGIMMVPIGDDPPEFGGLTFTEILSPTSVMLGWEPAVDDFTPQDGIFYQVYVAQTSGGEDFLSPFLVVTGETTVTITDLTPGETYYFVVRAFDDGGNTDGNTVELSVTMPLITDNTPPVFGGVKRAVLGAPDTVILSWNPATDDQTPPSEIVYRIY